MIEMSCERVRDESVAERYLTRRLPDDERDTFEAHSSSVRRASRSCVAGGGAGGVAPGRRTRPLVRISGALGGGSGSRGRNRRCHMADDGATAGAVSAHQHALLEVGSRRAASCGRCRARARQSRDGSGARTSH